MKTAALRIFILPVCIAAMTAITACTAQPIVSSEPRSLCENVDWYEAGRADGRMGYPASKLKAHQLRCNGTPHQVDVEMYTNGRETGLVEFCSPAGGLEAGRSGIPYEKVCPEHTEAAFLANYEIGKRIEALESDNNELESRINNLDELAGPLSTGSSMRAQIEQLRARRAQNNSQINELESRAGED